MPPQRSQCSRPIVGAGRLRASPRRSRRRRSLGCRRPRRRSPSTPTTGCAQSAGSAARSASRGRGPSRCPLGQPSFAPRSPAHTPRAQTTTGVSSRPVRPPGCRPPGCRGQGTKRSSADCRARRGRVHRNAVRDGAPSQNGRGPAARFCTKTQKAECAEELHLIGLVACEPAACFDCSILVSSV
eukprot:362322-Chlamydomonas_euryale.AAC.12